jgi:hypothetical protein
MNKASMKRAIELEGLSEFNVEYNDDTVTVFLPKAKIEVFTTKLPGVVESYRDVLNKAYEEYKETFKR